MKVENVNINNIKELKNRMPERWDIVVRKFPKASAWIDGDDFPTYNQLTELSKIFHVPFGYFFIDKLPERKYPIPHYRTISQCHFTPSLDLLECVDFAQKIQFWAKEILLEWGNEKIPFCGSCNTSMPVKDVVSRLNELFDIKTDFHEIPSWAEAFRLLLERAESKGIFVLVNGVVGNDTHRKLDVNEFRGFVLYDEIAPFIFINNNDAISAKIFTLIHEVAHILIGQSASFDLRNFIAANNEVEKFCDKCTAEFLVPEKELKNIYLKEKNLDNLAGYFKVSKITILRRLLDMGEIDKGDFFKKLNDLYQSELKKRDEQKVGGDFYNIVPLRLSKKFLYLLNRAIESNVIMYRDGLRITGLSRSSYENLLARFI
jgi:Zn-dependent peptidase ImmA (M78 family)